MLRRLRSALTLAGLWGAAWLPVGLAYGAATGWLALPRDAQLVTLGVWTGLGIVSGFCFALLVARLEHGRRVEQLRFGRLAAWGLLAGAGVPVGIALAVVVSFPGSYLTRGSGEVFALLGGLGACSALATLWLGNRRGMPAPTLAPPPNESLQLTDPPGVYQTSTAPRGPLRS